MKNASSYLLSFAEVHNEDSEDEVFSLQYSGSIGRNPIMPSVSFCEGLENEQYDVALVHSPRVIPNKEMSVFRPQSFVEKAALNRGWLDSSR